MFTGTVVGANTGGTAESVGCNGWTVTSLPVVLLGGLTAVCCPSPTVSATVLPQSVFSGDAFNNVSENGRIGPGSLLVVLDGGIVLESSAMLIVCWYLVSIGQCERSRGETYWCCHYS